MRRHSNKRTFHLRLSKWHFLLASVALVVNYGRVLVNLFASTSDDIGWSQSFRPSLPPALTTEKRRKVLVVLTGNLRCGEKAWKSLKTNVLDWNEADLALMVGTPNAKYQNASLFAMAKYHWPVPDYDDWADAVDLMFNGSQAWRARFFQTASHKSKIFGGIRYQHNSTAANENAGANDASPRHNGGYGGSVAIQMMIRFFLAQKIQQLNLTEIYDKFVITRSDHFYLCTHDLSKLHDSHLWLPDGEDYHGYTDRHLVVGNNQVLDALNIYPRLFVQGREKYDYIFAASDEEASHRNPEQLVKILWDDMNLSVRRFDRVMFTCATEGDSRSTLGRTMRGKQVIEGVHLKYPKEYGLSKAGCGTPISKEEWYPRKQENKKRGLLSRWRRSILGF